MRLITAILSILFLLAGSLAASAKKPSAHGARKPAASKKNTSVKSKRRGATRRVVARGQAAPSADRIMEIQAALARSGHYRGTPTGRIDPAMSAALSSFQAANGLDTTGRLGARTLKKLEQHGLPSNSPLTAAEQTGGVNQ